MVEATGEGADTALARIGRLVTEAQTGKAPVQRLADRISAVFVPIVIALAVATLGFWLGSGSSAESAFTAAVAVPPVAMRSSTRITRSPAFTASTWISISSVPYSRA